MVARASDLDLNDGPAKDSRLFLVDGNGLAYRAYYALPEDLATTDGFPTNALLGFAMMLFKLLVDYRPQGVVVAWDEKPTDRLAIAPDYKAGRRPTPPLLKEQQPHMRPLVESFGYQNLSIAPHEADDIIGTLSLLADQAGIPTCIVSTDRDAFQLVSERVCLMMTPRGVADVVVYTPERVAQRLGVPHTAVPDLIGLKGDTSDNIPGVPGIGDKTAAELLQRYGTLEGVYEHLDEIGGPKRRESLAAAHEDAFKSRELGTIKRQIEELHGFDLAGLVNRPPDRSQMGEFFRRFEFRNLLTRLDELEAALPAAQRAPIAVAEGDRWTWRAATPAELAAFAEDEVAVGIASADGLAAVAGEAARTALVTPVAAAGFAAALDGPGLVAHDFKALPHELHRAGLVPAFDTYLAAYLIDPGRTQYALEDLLVEQDIGIAVEPELGEEANVARAAAGALALRAPLYARLEERQLVRLLADVEQPLVGVLAAMEDAGVLIDPAVLDAIARRVEAEVAGLETRAYELAGGPFTLGSPKQLGEVLFERLALPVDRKGKTGYSTDQRVLAKIRHLHPIVEVIERWREITKLHSTYLVALPQAIGPDGRIHTTFNQTTAATGRLSSVNPNLQNIPVRTPLGREIRAAFIAAPGHVLLSADYSQVELRILAHLSGEPVLRSAFERGEDVHRATAAEVLGKDAATLTRDERDRAKAVNFGIVYGISSYGLAEQLGIPRDEAQTYIDTYLARYPRVQEFIKRTIAETRERGFATTVLGRRRPVPELRAQNWNMRSLGERLAVNSAIQGSAADIIKVAMIGCHRRLRDEGLRARLVLQIHDELLFEVPETETSAVTALVREEMVGAYPLDPPLVVETGTGYDWGSAK